ncbi:MAG: hypothetical protein AMXMBFR56_65890 [Polyangiaceae bacterium]
MTWPEAFVAAVAILAATLLLLALPVALAVRALWRAENDIDERAARCLREQLRKGKP